MYMYMETDSLENDAENSGENAHYCQLFMYICTGSLATYNVHVPVHTHTGLRPPEASYSFHQYTDDLR